MKKIAKLTQAILVDFDGVLVDTEYTTFCFYKKLLSDFGFHLKEDDFKYKIGRKSIDFFKDVLGKHFDQRLVYNWIKIKRQAFQKHVKKYLKPIPGSFNFLKRAQEAGFLLALASQNEKALIEKSVDVFKIRKYFKVILSLQDIKHKKPHPELYLKAARALDVLPSSAIVLEDTVEGIEAAKKGGFRVVCITTSFSKEELSGADMIIDSFNELSISFLKSLLSKY